MGQRVFVFLPHLFYIFGHILVKLYALCFELGELSNTKKHSYITLICKDKNKQK